MSVKLYTGRMGSGKTYEVVTEVILGAVRRGRRVVSNVAGLNVDAMYDLLESEGCDREKLGVVVIVDNGKVLEPVFWRTELSGGSEPESFIQPGDLLALDEIWRFWGGLGKTDSDGRKRPVSVMNFFRMHRHFIHQETGVACDVALITQDVMDVSRDVRSVVEETYYMEKLSVIGSAKRYRVDIFQGGKRSRKPLRSIQRGYNPELFPLYSSHSQKKEGGADAVEENIDGRGNVLKGLLFKVVLPLMIPLLIFALYVVWGFFHPKEQEQKTEKHVNKSPQKDLSPEAVRSDLKMADKWRVIGWYIQAGVLRVMLSDGKNARFIIDPPKYKLTSLSLEVELPEGGFATTWSGGRSESGLIPGVKQ